MLRAASLSNTASALCVSMAANCDVRRLTQVPGEQIGLEAVLGQLADTSYEVVAQRAALARIESLCRALPGLVLYGQSTFNGRAFKVTRTLATSEVLSILSEPV